MGPGVAGSYLRYELSGQSRLCELYSILPKIYPELQVGKRPETASTCYLCVCECSVRAESGIGNMQNTSVLCASALAMAMAGGQILNLAH